MSEDEAVEIDPTTDDDGTDAPADGTAGDDSEPARNDADGPDVDADTADADPETTGTDAESLDGLAARVAEHDDALAADVAAEIAGLEADLAAREEEVDELTSKLARVRADFSNYKERAKRKQAEIRERASESLVERIVPVRNDLLRALDQEDGSDIRPGVRSTVEKFDEVLADEGVDPIDPDPGESVDPARHQVMLRVDSDQPEGTVHEVYEPGYEMGDRVITEAQVTVSRSEE
ncbi:nucleotide exchange factor GrpE [Halorubrum sp. DTA98]|uniref:nucleotide exchange factor GrpE n=1 Tax=Halorubrum sp. DTA98 TaxID=3402163 RepID=UPI003AAA4086